MLRFILVLFVTVWVRHCVAEDFIYFTVTGEAVVTAATFDAQVVQRRSDSTKLSGEVFATKVERFVYDKNSGATMGMGMGFKLGRYAALEIEYKRCVASYWEQSSGPHAFRDNNGNALIIGNFDLELNSNMVTVSGLLFYDTGADILLFGGLGVGTSNISSDYEFQDYHRTSDGLDDIADIFRASSAESVFTAIAGVQLQMTEEVSLLLRLSILYIPSYGIDKIYPATTSRVVEGGGESELLGKGEEFTPGKPVEYGIYGIHPVFTTFGLGIKVSF